MDQYGVPLVVVVVVAAVVGAAPAAPAAQQTAFSFSYSNKSAWGATHPLAIWLFGRIPFSTTPYYLFFTFKNPLEGEHCLFLSPPLLPTLPFDLDWHHYAISYLGTTHLLPPPFSKPLFHSSLPWPHLH